MAGGASLENRVLCAFLGKKCAEFGNHCFLLRAVGKVSPFVRILAVVVELLRAIAILDEAIAGAAYGVVVRSKTGDGWVIPFGGWIL